MLNNEMLLKANSEIKTINVKGKEYATVNERLRVFRSYLPDWSIDTEIVSENGTSVTMKTYIRDDGGIIKATGIAHEDANNGYINKTSHYENCETSAVGRALGFLGFGVDKSISSADELVNAIKNQEKEKKAEKKFENVEELMPMGEMLNKVQELQSELKITDDKFSATLSKYFKKDTLEDLTYGEVTKLKEMLEAKKKRG